MEPTLSQAFWFGIVVGFGVSTVASLIERRAWRKDVVDPLLRIMKEQFGQSDGRGGL